jgi:hypothetical protein
VRWFERDSRSLGRQLAWLWAANANNTLGTWLAFDAFPLIAILVLHAGPTEVSLPAAAGLAVGAAVAVPLGPWVEFRRKRPVMVAMDLTRFAALMSVPAAFALGWLSFAQLLVVSVIVGAADQQRDHRGHDRPVGPLGPPHERPHRDRDRRAPHAGHPALAPTT